MKVVDFLAFAELPEATIFSYSTGKSRFRRLYRKGQTLFRDRVSPYGVVSREPYSFACQSLHPTFNGASFELETSFTSWTGSTNGNFAVYEDDDRGQLREFLTK